jgi:hypothetical protein
LESVVLFAAHTQMASKKNIDKNVEIMAKNILEGISCSYQ